MVKHRAALVSLCLTNYLVSQQSSNEDLNILSTGIKLDPDEGLELTSLFVFIYGLMYFYRWSLEYDWLEFSNFEKAQATFDQVNKYSKIQQNNRKVNDQKFEIIKSDGVKSAQTIGGMISGICGELNQMSSAYKDIFEYKSRLARIYGYISTALIPFSAVIISLYFSVNKLMY